MAWTKPNFLKTPGNHVVTVKEIYKKTSKTGYPQLQIEFITDQGALISTWITAKALDKKTNTVVDNKKAMELLAKLKLATGLAPTAKAEELKGKRVTITAQVDFLAVSDFNPAPAGGETGNGAPGFDDFNNPPPSVAETIPW